MAKEALQLKKQVVAEIKEKISKAKGVALVDYCGITVAQDTKLRKQLREAGVEYKVYKNRLVQIVMKDLGYEGLNKFLEQPTSIAISYDDPVAPAKIISDNIREMPKISLKAGIVEGSVMDKAGIERVAAIPPKPILVAQLLGMLTNPLRSLAVALSEIAKKKN